MRKQKRKRVTLALALFLIACIVVTGCGAGVEGNTKGNEAAQITAETVSNMYDVSVLFINAGKADSVLVQVDDKAYLIDTGEKESVPAIYRALESKGVHTLEGVFLTHKHSDHIGGLRAVSQRYKIGTVYSAEISQNEASGENKVDTLVQGLNLPHTKLAVGDKVEITEEVAFEVIGPIAYNAKDDNDNSLVLRLTVNGKTFLFTGDMQFAEEKTLLMEGVNLAADVLKVGNHGNPDATSRDFAEAVSPKLAIISTDTAIDTDSANKRVQDLFSNSQIYVTQDFKVGIGVTVDKTGALHVKDSMVQETKTDLSIVDVSKKQQTITLKNHGSDVDLTGYFIYSTQGAEVFNFPEGSVLRAGQSITISCTENEGDYLWNDRKVWSSKKEDTAILYDKYGNELATHLSQ